MLKPSFVKGVTNTYKIIGGRCLTGNLGMCHDKTINKNKTH